MWYAGIVADVMLPAVQTRYAMAAAVVHSFLKSC
jgi:hypothetical protein